jgi:hypothetical protein
MNEQTLKPPPQTKIVPKAIDYSEFNLKFRELMNSASQQLNNHSKSYKNNNNNKQNTRTDSPHTTRIVDNKTQSITNTNTEIIETLNTMFLEHSTEHCLQSDAMQIKHKTNNTTYEVIFDFLKNKQQLPINTTNNTESAFYAMTSCLIANNYRLPFAPDQTGTFDLRLEILYFMRYCYKHRKWLTNNQMVDSILITYFNSIQQNMCEYHNKYINTNNTPIHKIIDLYFEYMQSNNTLCDKIMLILCSCLMREPLQIHYFDNNGFIETKIYNKSQPQSHHLLIHTTKLMVSLYV